MVRKTNASPLTCLQLREGPVLPIDHDLLLNSSRCRCSCMELSTRSCPQGHVPKLPLLPYGRTQRMLRPGLHSDALRDGKTTSGMQPAYVCDQCTDGCVPSNDRRHNTSIQHVQMAHQASVEDGLQDLTPFRQAKRVLTGALYIGLCCPCGEEVSMASPGRRRAAQLCLSRQQRVLHDFCALHELRGWNRDFTVGLEEA